MAGLPPRVLSGVKPTGELHLANYFGAIQQHIQLQDEFPGECFFFIANYHALTTVRDPVALRDGSLAAAATYLALGLDPDKALLFRQTDVPEVLELSWLLACSARPSSTNTSIRLVVISAAALNSPRPPVGRPASR